MYQILRRTRDEEENEHDQDHEPTHDYNTSLWTMKREQTDTQDEDSGLLQGINTPISPQDRAKDYLQLAPMITITNPDNETVDMLHASNEYA